MGKGIVTLDIALSVILMFSAACYLALGLRLIAAKREVGTVPIGLLFAVISFWVVGGAIELMSTTFYVFSVGRTCHFVGTALLPVVAYFSFREYTGCRSSIHRIIMMLIIPLVSIAFAATNFFHEFMWYLPIANEAGEFLTRPAEWGRWFLFVHAPYSYAVIAAAMLTLMTHSSAVSRAQRRGLLLLAAACVAPLSATLAYDLGIGSDTVSFVPIVLTAMLPIYAWLILGEKIIEFTPLAYETVFQHMQDPVVVVDEQGRIIGLNRGAEALLDITETSALLEPLSVVLGGESPEIFEALDSGEPRNMLTATGRYLHVQVSDMASTRASLSDGKVLMFRDVSDVEKAQAEVRASEAMLRTLIDHSVNGIIRLRWIKSDDESEAKLRCAFANAAAARFLNMECDDLIDCGGEQIVRIATNAMDADEAKAIVAVFSKAIRTNDSVDKEIQHQSNGTTKWLRMICEPFGTDIALTLVDITDGKVKVEHMESIALSDPLTGVLNRRGFERDASRRLTESADDASGALLFIDLNDFKIINDTHGHEVGDELLTIASRRLKKGMRSCDIIGRPGGDEFVALVPDVTAEVAEQLARRLTETLEKPYTIGKNKLHCAASIGLALYPDNASTLTGLLREADQAMYRAKARCRGVTEIGSRDLLEKAM
jgi:diguanylate cyclase (GGDEF)-like protein